MNNIIWQLYDNFNFAILVKDNSACVIWKENCLSDAFSYFVFFFWYVNDVDIFAFLLFFFVLIFFWWRTMTALIVKMAPNFESTAAVRNCEYCLLLSIFWKSRLNMTHNLMKLTKKFLCSAICMSIVCLVFLTILSIYFLQFAKFEAYLFFAPHLYTDCCWLLCTNFITIYLYMVVKKKNVHFITTEVVSVHVFSSALCAEINHG